MEVLVIVGIVALLAFMVYPGGERDRRRAMQTACMSNLKQVGLAFRAWESDQVGTLPMQRSITNYGTMGFSYAPNAFRHFQVISNELVTPKLLLCPAEVDPARLSATTFNLKPLPGEIPFTSNSNLSYFVGLDAMETDPNTILCGDRNITNGLPLRNGVLELTTNYPATWTGELHRKVGNVLLADGSVQEERTIGLGASVTNAFTFTNRLLLPVLGP